MSVSIQIDTDLIQVPTQVHYRAIQYKCIGYKYNLRSDAIQGHRLYRSYLDSLNMKYKVNVIFLTHIM